MSCLRNASAQATHLAAQGRDALILGADSRGEFREEDQLCAARIADGLMREGFELADASTTALHERWAAAPDDAFVEGRSARYLRDTGQHADLRFVLEHIEDLSTVFAMRDGSVQAVA